MGNRFHVMKTFVNNNQRLELVGVASYPKYTCCHNTVQMVRFYKLLLWNIEAKLYFQDICNGITSI